MICTDCTSFLWMLAWRWSNQTATCWHSKILIFVLCFDGNFKTLCFFHLYISNTTGCSGLKFKKKKNGITYRATVSFPRIACSMQHNRASCCYQPTTSAKTTNCGSGTRVAMPHTTNFFFPLLLTKRTSFSLSLCNIRLAKRGPVGEEQRWITAQFIVGAIRAEGVLGLLFTKCGVRLLFLGC